MESYCSAKPNFQHVVEPSKFTYQLLDFIAPFQREESDESSRLRQRAVLLDLPNELLLQIFESLQNELYSLSLVSKRLHYLALPIYLARNGMSPFSGELILFDERSQDVLQALSIALFRPTLKRIHCTFNFGRPQKELIRNIRGMVRLASKLSRMEEVHFDIIRIPDMGQDLDSNLYKKLLMDDVGGDWEQEFLVLFRSVLETGCITLTVCLQGSGWSVVSTPNELVSAIGSRKWSSRLCGFFPCSSITCSFWCKSQGIDLPPVPSVVVPRGHIDLKTFNLHCSMLLNAQFCSRTIEILNSSCLSTLSLKHLCVDPAAWAIILPRIDLHALSSLSIDACTIMYEDLSDFLHRHPHITHLYLGRRLSPPPPDARLSKSALCQLSHLSATREYLISFLAPTGSSPYVKKVDLLVRILRGDRFNFKKLDNEMSSISYRLRKVELSLELSLESSTGDWMSPNIYPNYHKEDSIIPYIVKVHINLRTYYLPRDVMATLPRWLSSFPSLKQASISSPSQTPPTDVLLLHPFFHSMGKLCPGIETIEINDHTYDIEAYL
ncbi:hypothetical protein BDZ94DRAFT_478352 [Collybia nuda]|uniref:F-box domain-containing protein n=1 Tax=Collybia nuda TaxID=64659 RepID=A0A9P5Y8E8_9AGAR|nr:hypothetical protein BDZ94DRAFT_478352 [Collybia nuda]